MATDNVVVPLERPTGLALLRMPFPPHQISKLPKPTKAQTEDKARISCPICGARHHPQVIHLDYVGHAALTDRLLEADPGWYWEPMALVDGLPRFDEQGGLWIKLTVCGVTRLGYGQAAPSSYKDVGAREKEVIGDALRNAAMRFGAALDLWHKGDLHIEDPITPPIQQPKSKTEKRLDGGSQPVDRAHAAPDDAHVEPKGNQSPAIPGASQTESAPAVEPTTGPASTGTAGADIKLMQPGQIRIIKAKLKNANMEFEKGSPFWEKWGPLEELEFMQFAEVVSYISKGA